MRRKLVVPSPSQAQAPPVPPHKPNNNNINNNNNNYSINNNNNNNTTLRRRLDITAPRLHATTNPQALTEGAQYIKSDAPSASVAAAARCAKN